MKILAINGSPHKDGNTCKLINEIFRGAVGNSHICEIVHLIDLHLDYCNWCGSCSETGICAIDDGFKEHLKQIFKADVLIVATPSSTRSVTGYMKNWLDRFCNSQLIYRVDENKEVTKKSRVPTNKKAIIIVQGCTNLFQETIEPINVVMNVLEIPVIERLIVPNVGLTEEDSVDKRDDVMFKAFKIGQNLI
ncbi:MAG: flavodoxin family protein [Promethearchaeota archaeon]